MNKIIIAAAVALSAFTASAAGLTGFTSYDFNSLAGGSGTTQELATGVAVDTSVGKFDAVAIGSRVRLGAQDDQLGGEIGYSNSVKLGVGTITGRAALGRLNFRAGQPGLQYYSLGAEFTAPVTSTVGAFAGFRTRNAFNGTGAIENRFSAGVDFALSKNVAARVGYAHTVANGKNFNGVMTAVSYKF